MEEQKLTETFEKREEIYSGAVLHIVRDTVKLPNGAVSHREVALHNGAVAIVALTDNGDVLLERQYRYPHGRVMTEIPAGKLDGPDEDPLSAAARELREETGAVAGNMRYLGLYIPSPAILSEKIYMYLATDLKFGERELDEDEFLDVFRIPLEEAADRVMRGEIEDGKTQCAILRVYHILRDDNT